MGDGYAVEDHQSSNGTQVNGQKISRHPLAEGDVIAIGQTNFIYHGPSAEAPADAAGGEAPPPVKEKWVLEMETPDGNTETFDLEAKVTIGRNPKNTITIGDAKASNLHCEIVRDGPGYKVKDLNSTNGTRVDGKLVDELDLYHGSVISIGKTSFTIRNLAIPDAETGFDSGPVGGAEFASFSKKRRSFPVGLLVAVALVAGGLYGIHVLATHQVKTQGLPNPEGNLLEENYSFEGMSDSRGFPLGFRSLEGEGDDVAVQKSLARTGNVSLLVSKAPSEELDTELQVIYGREIPVAPGKLYEMTAWAMPSGLHGVCGAKIVWLSRKNPSFRFESYGNVLHEDADDFTELRVRGVVPLGASLAEAVFYIKGREGSAHLDDMEFREASAAEDRVLEGERLDLHVDGRGLFSIRRSGGLRDIVRDGQILLFVGKAGEERKAWQRYSRLAEGYPKAEAGRIEIRGEIFDFSSSGWIPFQEILAMKKGQIEVSWEVDDAGGRISLAGNSFAPEAEEIAGGVGIVTETSFQVKKGGFEAGNVTRMLWGPSTRPLSFNYAPPVYVRQVRDNEQVLFLQLLGRPEGSNTIRFSVHVQTNFNQVVEEIRQALSVARESERENHPGKAIAALKDVIVKYPFMSIQSESSCAPREEKTGAEWLSRLETAAFEKSEKIRTRFEVAQFFGNLREMEATLGDGRDFVKKYEGASEAKEIEELMTRIELAIRDQRIRQGQIDAQGFLLRAREHRDRKEEALASLLYEHVIRTWPGTEWAETADRELREMRGEAPKDEGKDEDGKKKPGGGEGEDGSGEEEPGSGGGEDGD
jgi:pSer/pThr/pTyr-binding forkhead associated (FHA) protein